MPKKSQIWFTDFVIALFIFTLILITYYTYTANISGQDTGIAASLIDDSQAITSSLLLSGFPDNWNNETVVQIGLTNNNQRINGSKLVKLEDINYPDAKLILGTVHDFFLFFEDSNSNLKQIGADCGYGSDNVDVNFTFVNTSYFKGEENDLEDEISELESEFGITIDQTWSSTNDFLSSINNYGIAVVENPKFNSGDVNEVEEFVSNGGIFFVTKRIMNGNSGNILGITYEKRTSCSSGGGLWTGITSSDTYLDLNIGEAFEADECNYISGSVESFGLYNDSTVSIAKWSFGNGTAYYLSDLDTISYDIQSKVKEAIKRRIVSCGTSDSVEVTASQKNLVKTERFVIFDSKPAKMVLYMWQ